MTRVSLLEFADQLGEVMPEIMREFAKRQLKEFYKDKITLPQCIVLEFLYREGALKMSNLAHFMNITTAAITGIAERLVRDGYIVRTYEPQDRRIIRVKLTAKGNALVRKINDSRRKMVIKIFGKISERDRRDYLRILLRIKEILTRENS